MNDLKTLEQVKKALQAEVVEDLYTALKMVQSFISADSPKYALLTHFLSLYREVNSIKKQISR